MLTYMRPLIPRQSWIRLYNHNPYRVNSAPTQQILFGITIVFYARVLELNDFLDAKSFGVSSSTIIIIELILWKYCEWQISNFHTHKDKIMMEKL